MTFVPSNTPGVKDLIFGLLLLRSRLPVQEEQEPERRSSSLLPFLKMQSPNRTSQASTAAMQARMMR